MAITLGLTGVVFSLIEGSRVGWTPWVLGCAAIGAVSLVVFVVVELQARDPLLPLPLFRSWQFTGTNLTTFAVYAALGGALFIVALQLQQSMGYSALEAGAATAPSTAIMLFGSTWSGKVGQAIGPRIPMTVGPLVAAVGLALMARIEPGTGYVGVVLPAVVVFGVGMTVTVAPLTAAALGAVDAAYSGTAAGVNNAVARLAGLIAVAVLPAAASIRAGPGEPLGPGFATAMIIAAVGGAAGGVIAGITVRTGDTTTARVHPAPSHGCHPPESAWAIDRRA